MLSPAHFRPASTPSPPACDGGRNVRRTREAEQRPGRPVHRAPHASAVKASARHLFSDTWPSLSHSQAPFHREEAGHVTVSCPQKGGAMERETAVQVVS